MLDAVKKLLLIGVGKDELSALKKEFGVQSKQMLLNVYVPHQSEGEEVLRMMELD